MYVYFDKKKADITPLVYIKLSSVGFFFTSGVRKPQLPIYDGNVITKQKYLKLLIQDWGY